jgi:hypothetical protein
VPRLFPLVTSGLFDGLDGGALEARSEDLLAFGLLFLRYEVLKSEKRR